MNVKERAVTAFAMAWRMKVFVITLVGLAMHVATVRGLKRYLELRSVFRFHG